MKRRRQETAGTAGQSDGTFLLMVMDGEDEAALH